MADMVRFAADGLLIFVLGCASIVAVYWALHQPRRRIVAVIPFVIMAGLTSLLSGKLASVVYQPDSARPFVVRGVKAGAAYIDNPGFPSDHALLAVVVVAAVWFVTGYRRVAFMLATLTLIMVAARVVALVHTPIDVVGGVMAGLIGAVWYFRMSDKA
ncbi:MAG: phosphatase PAP2 family protein [Candidatus Saccharimonadales bacterium]